MTILGSLGTVGLAVALTFLLILGTKSGGKVKPLGWGATLVLSMIAGAAYKAAGQPFDLVSSLVNDAISLTGEVLPRYSMPGMALTLLIVILWAKLSTRQVAMIGIAFWYVASGADGAWGIVADWIQLVATRVAS